MAFTSSLCSTLGLKIVHVFYVVAGGEPVAELELRRFVSVRRAVSFHFVKGGRIYGNKPIHSFLVPSTTSPPTRSFVSSSSFVCVRPICVNIVHIRVTQSTQYTVFICIAYLMIGQCFLNFVVVEVGLKKVRRCCGARCGHCSLITISL